MPDPAARDPHTPIFDQERACCGSRCRGATWSGGSIRRPATIKLVTTPTPRSLPVRHGRQTRRACRSSCSSAPTRSRSIDPKTMAIKEYTLPNPGDAAAPHRDHERRRDLVFGLFARLSRPVRSEDRRRSRNGASPAARSRSPTASRRSTTSSGTANRRVSPNTLVRFDPKTEKFQTWAIPSGGGVVRNMMPTQGRQSGAGVKAASTGSALVEIK